MLFCQIFVFKQYNTHWNYNVKSFTILRSIGNIAFDYVIKLNKAYLNGLLFILYILYNNWNNKNNISTNFMQHPKFGYDMKTDI